MSSMDNVGYFACHIKQFSLSSHDTASLLLYSDGMFHCISGASFCLDESEKPVITGTLGDKISNIVLIQVNWADVLGSIYVSLMMLKVPQGCWEIFCWQLLTLSPTQSHPQQTMSIHFSEMPI
jgi:hypothetical protein